MTEPTRYEEHELTHDEAEQARIFMRVLKTKGYAVPQMANILGEMGRTLVAHANEVVSKIEGAR